MRKRKSPVPHTVRSYRRGAGRPNPLVIKKRITNPHSSSFTEKLQSRNKLLKILRAKHYTKQSEMPEIVEDMEKRRSALVKQPPWKKRGYGTISVLFGRTLYSIVESTKPNLVVETGSGMGTGSSYILSALEKNKKGKLISVDIQPKAGQLIDPKLKRRWQLKVGRSSDVLPKLDVRNIDIFFHDSLHSYKNMTQEFEWAYPRLRKGGVIVADDITWNTSIQDFARKHNEKVYYIQTSKSKFRGAAIIKTR